MRKIAIVAIVIFIVTVPTVFAAGADCPPRFAYSGPNGPPNWPRLDIPGNECGAGDQSPVNITGWESDTGPVISVSYQDAVAMVENTGVGVKVKPSGTSFITIEGVPHYLKEFHFHTKSEHTVDGHQYDGELHLVHHPEAGPAAVIALFVTVDRPNALVSSVLRVLPREICKSGRTQDAIPLSGVLPEVIANYFTYTGSLTTPPCNRGIIFYIPTNVPFTVSRAEYDALAKLGPNARWPVQPIGDREIVLVRALK